MKNILVTGGCGFIASNFINYFLNKFTEYKIVNIDALYYCGNESNIIEKHRNSSNYKFIKGNICQNDLINFQAREKIKNYDSNIIAMKYLNLYKKKLLK